jgi:hypothetical protein
VGVVVRVVMVVQVLVAIAAVHVDAAVGKVFPVGKEDMGGKYIVAVLLALGARISLYACGCSAMYHVQRWCYAVLFERSH